MNPEQQSLFGGTAHARRGDPETSHEAADSISRERIRRSQAAVLVVLMKHGPMDDPTLAQKYFQTPGLPRQSISGLRTRRRELTDKGMVYDTGNRTILESGRHAIVWAAAK